jgi:drug/metabolite transporter (DMT)-like permease
VLAGLASVVTLPLAIFLTRFSEAYELIHAAFATPVAALLGVVALALARRSKRRISLSLSSERRDGAAVAGRLLGIAGVCMALAALVALGVYGLLEYVGSRD